MLQRNEASWFTRIQMGTDENLDPTDYWTKVFSEVTLQIQRRRSYSLPGLESSELLELSVRNWFAGYLLAISGVIKR